MLAILDKIDQHLNDADSKKMTRVDEHAAAIVSLVGELEGPIGAFPQVSKEMAQLKTQASKFDAASRKKNHKDQHDHHHQLADITKKIRGAL